MAISGSMTKMIKITIILVLLTTISYAQDKVCDSVCLAASMDRLQETLAEHNRLLAIQIADAQPKSLTKKQHAMKIVNALGSLATVAVPIILTQTQAKVVKVVKVTK